MPGALVYTQKDHEALVVDFVDCGLYY